MGSCESWIREGWGSCGMKVETKEVLQVKIYEIPDLGTIKVVLEDLKLGEGQITISCYGVSYSAYWSGLGAFLLITPTVTQYWFLLITN